MSRTKANTGIGRWIRRLRLLGLGEARDDFLMIAAFLYGLGYLVWSLHAWRFNLGLLPAFDSQYFIAGIIPALTVILAYLGAKWAQHYLEKLREALGPGATGFRQILRIVIFGTTTISFAIFKFPDAGWFQRLFPWLAAHRFITFIWIILLLILPAPDSSYEPLMKGYMRAMVVYVALLFPMVGIGLYSERLHPVLPQELGGGRPRCAVLDIERSQLSEAMMKVMLTGPALDAVQIQQSVAVDVFYDGKDFLLIKPRSDNQPRTTTYEIKKDSVRGITWCK